MLVKSILRMFVSLSLLATLAAAQAPDPSAASDEGEVIQTFYIENADVKDVMTILRSLLGVKNVAADEGLNAILIRDKMKTVRLAAELVAAQDQPRNEVVVDVKLIELGKDELHGLGGAAGLPLRLSEGELQRLEQKASARLLAHPKLSALVGDRAELMVGDRVPITVDGQGTVNYQEVGFRLTVVPRVHSSTQEVTLDFEMEMSHRTSGEPGRPVIETSHIASSARLKGGETYLLAGLLHGDTGPFDATKETGESEVVLALTPHITRRLEVGTLGNPIRMDAAP